MSKYHRPCKLWGKQFNVTPFTRVVLVKTETGNWLTIYDKDDSLEVSSKLIESDQELEDLILEAKYTIAEALNSYIYVTKDVLDSLPHDALLTLKCSPSELFYNVPPKGCDDEVGWYRGGETIFADVCTPFDPIGEECKADNYSALKALYHFGLNGQKPL